LIVQAYLDFQRMAGEAFRPATEVLSLGLGLSTYRKLMAVLRAEPSIRRRKPSRQRLLVHVGDLVRHLNRTRGAAFAHADEFAAAVNARKDEIRRRGQRKA
jgi:hypothetical protein